MTDKSRRAAIYARTSTEDQTTQNQLDELRRWAKNAGHTVAGIFDDPGISGAKGRDKRPRFDAMLKGGVRRSGRLESVFMSTRKRSTPRCRRAGRCFRCWACLPSSSAR
jgi:hypothetical protein